jgi:hypothetical protein
MLGKDWHMTGDLLSRGFKCFVTRYDPDKEWRGKDIPKVYCLASLSLFLLQALYVKCHRDAYTDDETEKFGWDMSQETELDLVNYGRLRHIYLSKNQQSVAPVATAAAAEASPETAAGADAELSKRRKKTSKVHDFLRELDPELDPEQYGGCTRQCLICAELLKQRGGGTDKLIVHFGSTDPSKPNKHEQLVATTDRAIPSNGK